MNIFTFDDDRKSADILKVSNYFDVLVSKTEATMKENVTREMDIDFQGLLGRISMAIKSVFDVADMKMFVADTSHFT